MFSLTSKVIVLVNHRLISYGQVSSKFVSRRNCDPGQVSNCLKAPITGNFTPCVFFHSSRPHYALPPVLLMLLRPFTRFIAIAFGRTLRIWWRKLPEKRRERLIEAMKQQKYMFLALLAPVPVGAVCFYVTHIDESPITKRKRFIAFSNDQVVQLAAIEQQVICSEQGNNIVSPSHPLYCRVRRVVYRLLESNKDVVGIHDVPWQIIVMDVPEIANAFVLPNGTIFIYTGMLNLCSNDNQLSIVLAHEMSHTILHHTAERMTNAQLIELLLFVPIVLIWAALPDAGALVAQWFSAFVAKMLLHLPFSRLTEMEADDVGLTLAARACFDIREAPCFWIKMKALGSDEGDNLEWLSTHPSYDTRMLFLEDLIPKAMKVRETCQCPKLSSHDPRFFVDTDIKKYIQTLSSKKSLDKV